MCIYSFNTHKSQFYLSILGYGQLSVFDVRLTVQLSASCNCQSQCVLSEINDDGDDDKTVYSVKD